MSRNDTRVALSAQAPLATLLARSTGPSDLLPHLHQHAVERSGGVCSMLFRHNPRNAAMQATSGFRLDSLRTDPWLPELEEAAIVTGAFDRRAPILVPDADARMPDLASRLGASCALLVPLVRNGDRIGLLVIGFAEPPAAVAEDVKEVGDAFLAALELFHRRQSDELQRDVRALLDEFSASLSATLNLNAGLDIFCHGANMLFGADRASVWIHDRRARELILQASSDPEHATRFVRVSVDDDSAPAAAAMRRARAEIVPPVGDEMEDVTAMVTVPLRGTRRALGTIVFEGVRVDPGGELDLLDRADELGRQLSSAIENMQLLDELIRSRRELENTFD